MNKIPVPPLHRSPLAALHYPRSTQLASKKLQKRKNSNEFSSSQPFSLFPIESKRLSKDRKPYSMSSLRSLKNYNGALDLLFSSRDTEPQKIATTKLTIRIHSNWGNQTKISCNEIDFLDIRGSRIDVFSCHHVTVHDRKPISKLTNSVLTDESDVWIEEWPPSDHSDDITLEFVLPKDPEVQMVRVWPSHNDVTQNIKNVTVYADDYKVFSGDFPYDIGSNIHLAMPLKGDLLRFTQEETTREKREDYAQIKLRPTYITFTPTMIYEQNSMISTPDLSPLLENETIPGQIEPFYSLERIALFDSNGDQITHNLKVHINHIKEDFNPMSLFRRIFYEKDEDDIPVRLNYYPGGTQAKISTDNEIRVQLLETCDIGAIVLINAKHSTEFGFRHNVRHMEIKFDGKHVWSGRIKQTDVQHPINRKNVTFVFFNDSRKYQKKIYEKFPIV